MELKFSKTERTGQRVQGFVDTQAPILGAAITPALKAKLDQAVQQLSDAKRAQAAADAAALGETARIDALKLALFDNFLVYIGRVARVELVGSSDLPALTISVDDARSTAFVGKVAAAAAAVEKHQDIFTANGMAPGFVAGLDAALAALVEAEKTRETHVANRATATGQTAEGDRAVKRAIGYVDAALRPLLRTNRPLAAGWATAKLVHETTVNPLPTGLPATQPASSGPTPAVPATSSPTPDTPAGA